MMPSVKILLLSVAAAVCYGIVHDQITARISVEYFTIGHPPIFHTDNPTLLGLGWGVLATWWAGLLIGVPLELCAQRGDLPKRSAASLVKPIAILLLVMACAATMAGLAGSFAASTHLVVLPEPYASEVRADRQADFIIAAAIHQASYATAFVGGIILCYSVRRSRIGRVDLDGS